MTRRFSEFYGKKRVLTVCGAEESHEGGRVGQAGHDAAPGLISVGGGASRAMHEIGRKCQRLSPDVDMTAGVLLALPGDEFRLADGGNFASECSSRLAQMRPSSQPTVHRLLKEHCDECGTGDAWQAGHDAVIGCFVPSE